MVEEDVACRYYLRDSDGVRHTVIVVYNRERRLYEMWLGPYGRRPPMLRWIG